MPAITVAILWIRVGGSRFSRAAMEIVDMSTDGRHNEQAEAAESAEYTG
jgi:hypothetical protein